MAQDLFWEITHSALPLFLFNCKLPVTSDSDITLNHNNGLDLIGIVCSFLNPQLLDFKWQSSKQDRHVP